MYQNITYFKGFTALRFWAALLVVLFHAELIKQTFGMRNYALYSLFQNGDVAVSFFFVLSGFLITYFLLREFTTTHSIAIGMFYGRRMLRIGPLYYFMVFIGLVIVPVVTQLLHLPVTSVYEPKEVWGYYVFLIPFVVNALYPSGHALECLWSIGVEEMFYLGWAPLFKWVHKQLPSILWGIIMIKSIAYYWFHYIHYDPIALKFLYMLQFEAMAIGGLTAYYLFYSKRPLTRSWWLSIPCQAILWSLIVTRLLFHQYLLAFSSYGALFDVPIFSHLLLLGLFSWLLLCNALSTKPFINLNHTLWNHLGNLSYGIYMYHALLLSLLAMFLKPLLETFPAWTATLIFYTIALPIVIGTAHLSKRYLEDWFLKKKSLLKPSIPPKHVLQEHS